VAERFFAVTINQAIFAGALRRFRVLMKE